MEFKIEKRTKKLEVTLKFYEKKYCNDCRFKQYYRERGIASNPPNYDLRGTYYCTLFLDKSGACVALDTEEEVEGIVRPKKCKQCIKKFGE